MTNSVDSLKDKITVIKIPSFKVERKLHAASIIVEFICSLKSISLSKTEICVLAHFMCEGYNEISREQVIDGKLLKNKNTLANMLTVFRKHGILKKDGYKEHLSVDFSYPITDKIKFEIMLDNT